MSYLTRKQLEVLDAMQDQRSRYALRNAWLTLNYIEGLKMLIEEAGGNPGDPNQRR